MDLPSEVASRAASAIYSADFLLIAGGAGTEGGIFERSVAFSESQNSKDSMVVIVESLAKREHSSKQPFYCVTALSAPTEIIRRP